MLMWMLATKMPIEDDETMSAGEGRGEERRRRISLQGLYASQLRCAVTGSPARCV